MPEIGPYRGAAAATLVGQDKLIAALSRNREEHPGRYYLNPFVGGPITELATRLARRVNAGVATSPTLAYTGPVGIPLAAMVGGPARRTEARRLYQESSAPEYSDREPDVEEVARQDKRRASRTEKQSAEGGPCRADRGAHVEALDPAIAMTARSRDQHPNHYYLNPFVPGPLSELIMRGSRRHYATQASGSVAGPLSEAGMVLPDTQLPTLAVTTAMGGPRRRVEARRQYETSGASEYGDEKRDRETAERQRKRRDEKKSAQVYFRKLAAALTKASVYPAIGAVPNTSTQPPTPNPVALAPTSPPKRPQLFPPKPAGPGKWGDGLGWGGGVLHRGGVGPGHNQVVPPVVPGSSWWSTPQR